MKGLKLFLLVNIFILLLVVGWIGQLSLVVERTLLDPRFYQGLFNELSLITHLQQSIVDHITAKLDSRLPPQIVEAVGEAAADAFNLGWLDQQVNHLIEGFLGYVKGEHPSITVTVELQGQMEVFTAKLIDLLKPLSPIQLSSMGLEEKTLSIVAASIISQLELPDRISLDEIIEQKPGFREAVSRIERIRGYLRYLPVVVLLVLVLLCLLLAGLSGGLKWLGISLLASGLTFFAGLLLLRFTTIVSLVLAPLNRTNLVASMGGVLDSILAVTGYFMRSVQIIPLILVGSGLVIMTAGIAAGKLIHTGKAGVY